MIPKLKKVTTLDAFSRSEFGGWNPGSKTCARITRRGHPLLQMELIWPVAGNCVKSTWEVDTQTWKVPIHTWKMQATPGICSERTWEMSWKESGKCLRGKWSTARKIMKYYSVSPRTFWTHFQHLLPSLELISVRLQPSLSLFLLC